MNFDDTARVLWSMARSVAGRTYADRSIPQRAIQDSGGTPLPECSSHRGMRQLSAGMLRRGTALVGQLCRSESDTQRGLCREAETEGGCTAQALGKLGASPIDKACGIDTLQTQEKTRNKQMCQAVKGG